MRPETRCLLLIVLVVLVLQVLRVLERAFDRQRRRIRQLENRHRPLPPWDGGFDVDDDDDPPFYKGQHIEEVRR